MKTIELRMKLPDEVADRVQAAAQGDDGDWERLRRIMAETPTPQEEAPLTFRTPNLTLEKYAALSNEEKIRLYSETYEANREWVERELQRHGAVWIAVIDGRVVASSSLKDIPDGRRIRQLGAGSGKQAFVFLDQSQFVIEETVGWNSTRRGDAYPAVPLTVAHESGAPSISLVADFDTGSTDTYLPLEDSVVQGIVEHDPSVPAVPYAHAKGTLKCVSHYVLATLETSSPLKGFYVLFVMDWQSSPMVQVNPQRAALVGRDLPAAMGSKMELDFEARTTTVKPVEEAAPG